MTTINNKGVNIVTLQPYCGRELRIQPNKSVDEEKEFKHINSGYRKKNSDTDQKQMKGIKI